MTRHWKVHQPSFPQTFETVNARLCTLASTLSFPYTNAHSLSCSFVHFFLSCIKLRSIASLRLFAIFQSAMHSCELRSQQARSVPPLLVALRMFTLLVFLLVSRWIEEKNAPVAFVECSDFSSLKCWFLQFQLLKHLLAVINWILCLHTNALTNSFQLANDIFISNYANSLSHRGKENTCSSRVDKICFQRRQTISNQPMRLVIASQPQYLCQYQVTASPQEPQENCATAALIARNLHKSSIKSWLASHNDIDRKSNYNKRDGCLIINQKRVAVLDEMTKESGAKMSRNSKKVAATLVNIFCFVFGKQNHTNGSLNSRPNSFIAALFLKLSN